MELIDRMEFTTCRKLLGIILIQESKSCNKCITSDGDDKSCYNDFYFYQFNNVINDRYIAASSDLAFLLLYSQVFNYGYKKMEDSNNAVKTAKILKFVINLFDEIADRFLNSSAILGQKTNIGTICESNPERICYNTCSKCIRFPSCLLRIALQIMDSRVLSPNGTTDLLGDIILPCIFHFIYIKASLNNAKIRLMDRTGTTITTGTDGSFSEGRTHEQGKCDLIGEKYYFLHSINLPTLSPGITPESNDDGQPCTSALKDSLDFSILLKCLTHVICELKRSLLTGCHRIKLKCMTDFIHNIPKLPLDKKDKLKLWKLTNEIALDTDKLPEQINRVNVCHIDVHNDTTRTTSITQFDNEEDADLILNDIKNYVYKQIAYNS